MLVTRASLWWSIVEIYFLDLRMIVAHCIIAMTVVIYLPMCGIFIYQQVNLMIVVAPLLRWRWKESSLLVFLLTWGDCIDYLCMSVTINFAGCFRVNNMMFFIISSPYHWALPLTRIINYFWRYLIRHTSIHAIKCIGIMYSTMRYQLLNDLMRLVMKMLLCIMELLLLLLLLRLCPLQLLLLRLLILCLLLIKLVFYY